MPGLERYFFHIVDGEMLVDRIGSELGGVEEAWTEAIQTAAEELRDRGRKGWLGSEWALHVTNDAEETIFVLRFFIERFGREG